MRLKLFGCLIVWLLSSYHNGANAQVTLEQEVKITDEVLFFDGNKVALNTSTNSSTGYDYVYGNALTPHGDCVKAYKEYVFMTWYRGGKEDRHVMLTRYNTLTGALKTIEFPHQHTGYNGKYYLGETHNTIAVGICPKNGSIHLLYDMHRNGNVPAFENDFFRYSYSVADAATVSDDEFTLSQFVNSTTNNYKHQMLPGVTDVNTTNLLTYPAFFTNGEGDLFMKMRFGYSENGKFLFAKYDGTIWEGYTDFNRVSASSSGSPYNWGLYGDLKYLNGKLRIGFQQRANLNNDKFLYQNGFYYAYSDDPSGKTLWKDYKGQGFSIPLAKSDLVKISEPGDLVATTQKDKVYMVSGFDWTVTDKEDVHFIGKVTDNENNVTKYVHTYKSVGDAEFTTSTEFSGAEALYASGNDVFVIGLKNNRVSILKTEGGTNNFTTVYESTTGKMFDKGAIVVENGKLYYYLKEKGGSGDKRTTYLQIYDLDIAPVDPTRSLSFKDLLNGQEIERGANLTIEANAGSAFKEVSLWSGDTNLGTLTAAPFSWSSHAILTDMQDDSYNFKLIAKDDADATVEKTITLNTPAIIVPDVLTDKISLHISFEDNAISNWETDGADYGVTPAIVDAINPRAGSKAIAFEFTEGTSGHHVQNTVDKVVVPDQSYFHMIAYSATSDVAFGQTIPTAKLDDWAPTPPITTHAAALVFERKITSRQNTKGAPFNCYPRLRSKAQGGACIVYYDDIVLYSHSSATADLVPPTAAENFALVEQSATSVDISWSEGTDALTGITETLILRTSNLNAAAPELKPQAAYATANIVGGINVVGNWEVIAFLPAGTTTYTDDARTAGQSYKYVVVHKDLAYNYSIPLTDGQTVIDPVETVDTEAPTSAGSFAYSAPSFSWTEGTDAASGIDATIILRTSNMSATAPQMVAKVAYAPTVATGTVNAIGDWDVIASLPVGTTTYTDATKNTNESYKYAIVHRDVALNYSSALLGDVSVTAPVVVVDAEAPTSAENLAYNAPLLSWTEGVDDSGITGTLILRTSNTLAAAPQMVVKVVYAPTVATGTVNTIGDWEVIAALPAGTTSYSDDARDANQSCQYAVVHKDAALNYSSPLVAVSEITSINEDMMTTYKCYSIKGGIQLEDLKTNSNISIYNISGVKVFQQQANASNLSVALSQGVYIVKIAGKATKVVVK